eukprot:scaffold75404_cov31-Attheya_sp.AAC.1
MKEKGIDIYLLVQETWLPNDFERDINRHYIFHHGTPEASDSNTGGEATGANTREEAQPLYSHHKLLLHGRKRDNQNLQGVESFLDVPDS